MRILTLLKYGLKGSSLILTRRSKMSGVLIAAFSSLIFGFPIYILEYYTFKAVPPGQVYDLLGGMWSTIMSLLLLASFTPALIYSLTGSEEREMLSTMPIHEWEYKMYTTVVTFIANSMMPAAYIFGLLGMYAGVGRGIPAGILPALSHTFLMLSVSLLLASLLSWRVKASRRLYLYSFLLDLILLALVILVNPATAEKPVEMARKIANFKWLFSSYFSPFYWPVSGKWWMSAIAGTLVVLFSLSVPMGEITRGNSKRSRNFFGKEITLFIRKEQNMFFLIYPFVFSLLYGYFMRSPTIMFILHASFTAFYSSVSAASLIQEELLSYPLSMTFPVDPVKIVTTKLRVTAAGYLTFILAVALAGGFWKASFWSVIVFLTSSIGALLTAVSYGMLEASRNPDFNRGKVLSTSGIAKVESVGVGLAILGCAIPLGMLDVVYEIPSWGKTSVWLLQIALSVFLTIRFLRETVKEISSFEF